MASIKYRIYKNVSAAGEKDKYYARAFHDETVGLEELAKHMSEHNTPYSPGTIHGVLKDMVACVRELLLDSKKVKLDNLAIFSLGLSSKPADSPAEFTVAGNITKAYISAFGVDDRTVTTNHERQAELIRTVIDQADKRYLLVDHSKLGRTGLYRLSARGAFDAIFTDR